MGHRSTSEQVRGYSKNNSLLVPCGGGVKKERTGRCKNCNTVFRVLASDIQQSCPFCNAVFLEASAQSVILAPINHSISFSPVNKKKKRKKKR